jgi:hypothetical protein
MQVVAMMGEEQGDPMELVKSGVLSKTLALATSSDAEVRRKAGKVLAGECVYVCVCVCALL